MNRHAFNGSCLRISVKRFGGGSGGCARLTLAFDDDVVEEMLDAGILFIWEEIYWRRRPRVKNSLLNGRFLDKFICYWINLKRIKVPSKAIVSLSLTLCLANCWP